jgi:4-hydroxy-2-oxoglutarate aldolase
VVTGSTGEAALLDAAERAALVETAREAVPKDRLLIVGTGAESTRTCLQQSRDAAGRGADAVLVVAPHYYGSAMTLEALRQHYRRVADESPVPVVLYSIPKYMHFSLPSGLVAELAEHPNVIGIKDSSGQRDQLAGYLESQSDSFAVLTGNGPLFHHSLVAGARGGILAVSLFAAALTLEVYRSFLAGDESAAAAAQARLTPPGAKIVGELGIPGVKAAMDQVGLCGGPVRSPLLPLRSDQYRMVDELLRTAEAATA